MLQLESSSNLSLVAGYAVNAALYYIPSVICIIFGAKHLLGTWERKLQKGQSVCSLPDSPKYGS